MRRFHRLSIPESAHPLIRRLYEEMSYQQLGVTDTAERAGVARETIKGWRKNHCPRIGELEACFNVLGYTLKPTRMKDNDD